MQDRRGRVQAQRRVGDDAGVVPAALGSPLRPEHVVGEVDAEPRAGQDLRQPLGADRVLGGRDLDLQGAVHVMHVIRPSRRGSG